MHNYARKQYPVNHHQQQQPQQQWQQTGSRKIRYHDVPTYTTDQPQQTNYSSNNNFGTANGIRKQSSMEARREDFRIQKVYNKVNGYYRMAFPSGQNRPKTV